MTERGLKNINVFFIQRLQTFIIFVTFFNFFNVFYFFFWNVFYIYELDGQFGVGDCLTHSHDTGHEI